MSARRRRDAARSRAAILAAAEELFAARGFAGTSLQAVAAAAGLARGTPSYFFGSKRDLYVAVLRQVTTAREEALSQAFAPMRRWADDGADGVAGLDAALERAIAGYVRFLEARPAFARLIEWEALAGGEHLQEVLERSTAIGDAVRALHAVRRERGLAEFDTTHVQVALVSLLYLPIAHEATFAGGGGIDTASTGFRRGYLALVRRLALAMLTG